MKTHVLLVSKTFPIGHPRKGQPTNFLTKILDAKKLHTIRSNFEYWKPKIDEINAGQAILSIRNWTGKPYGSKQVEVHRLTKADGVGIQRLDMTALGWFIDTYESDISTEYLAQNDGLTLPDFKAWFKGYKMEDLVIIHFTPFRYTVAKNS